MRWGLSVDGLAGAVRPLLSSICFQALAESSSFVVGSALLSGLRHGSCAHGRPVFGYFGFWHAEFSSALSPQISAALYSVFAELHKSSRSESHDSKV